MLPTQKRYHFASSDLKLTARITGEGKYEQRKHHREELSYSTHPHGLFEAVYFDEYRQRGWTSSLQLNCRRSKHFLRLLQDQQPQDCEHVIDLKIATNFQRKGES